MKIKIKKTKPKLKEFEEEFLNPLWMLVISFCMIYLLTELISQDISLIGKIGLTLAYIIVVVKLIVVWFSITISKN